MIVIRNACPRSASWPIGRSPKIAGGEWLDDLAVKFSQPRQQPSLWLAEAQAPHSDGRRLQLGLHADRIARIPGVLVGGLRPMAVVKRHENFAFADSVDHHGGTFP